jgi:hypothetical protein
MSLEIKINGSLIDLSGREVIEVKYQICKIGEVLKSVLSYSVEVVLPPTKNNLRIFGYNDSIITTDNAVYSPYVVTAEKDGIDMLIYSCELVSHSPLTVRFFGTSANFFNLIKDVKIGDLSYTDLDHTRDYAAMSSVFTATSEYCYPIINYGELVGPEIYGGDWDSNITINGEYLTNNLNCESLYPAVSIKSILGRSVTQNGYALTNELDSDTYYPKMIIPFCNKKVVIYTEEEINDCAFEAYSSGQTVTVVTETKLTFANEVTDIGSNFVSPDYTTPFEAYFSFALEVSAKSAVALTTTDITFSLYKKPPAGAAVLIDQATNNFTAVFSSFNCFGGFYFIEEGYTVYVTATPLTQNGSFQGGVDANGNGYTRFSFNGIYNESVFGAPWFIGRNLPKLNISALWEYILFQYCAILQVNEITKVISVTKLDTIIKNKSNGKDWTSKLDLSVKPKITYEIDPKLAKVNNLTYLDDENLVKPAGTDYSFSVDNAKQNEVDLYTAPFAASKSQLQFIQLLNVCDVEIGGVNELKPRILISKLYRLAKRGAGEELEFFVGGVSQGTESQVNIPYFANPSLPYDLTFTKIVNTNFANYLSLIRTPRQLIALFRLTDSDINQLDVTKPIWIGQTGNEVINAWFIITEIQNYSLTDKKSTLVTLNLLP